MTRAFYFIKNNNQKGEELKEISENFNKRYGKNAKIYIREDMKWLPIYSEKRCEGCYEKDIKFMSETEREFSQPVLFMSVFDSDICFLSLMTGGKIYNFSDADEDIAYEFDIPEEYLDFPEILCEQGIDRERFEEIWRSEDYTFAEDKLEDIAELLETELMFGDEV